MQYPVIDLIAQAYLNNGWTGLDISTGKNLFNPNSSDNYWVTVSNVVATSATSKSCTINANENEEITLSNETPSSGSNILLLAFLDENNNVLSRNVVTKGDTYLTRIAPSGTVYVLASFYTWSLVVNAQLEKGPLSQYEPYNPNPSNDFPNRLKLPLPHYFPHPVIDALERAAAGTQTADDTEVLRHYLTPLGIGGI